MKFLFIPALIFLFGCSASKRASLKKGKNEILNWILTNEEAVYVDKKFITINNIASLRLNVQNCDQKKCGFTLNILSSPLNFKDSIDLQKSIVHQKNILTKLPTGKKYLEERKPTDFDFKPYIRISDPIYFSKEKIYIIIYEIRCGYRCGEGIIKAYKKTTEGFTLLREIEIWIS